MVFLFCHRTFHLISAIPRPTPWRLCDSDPNKLAGKGWSVGFHTRAGCGTINQVLITGLSVLPGSGCIPGLSVLALKLQDLCCASACLRVWYIFAQIILTRRASPFRVSKEITPESRLFVEAARIQSGVNFHAENYSFINKGSTSNTESASSLDVPRMAK
jgi:hypothetical protein